MSKVGDRVGALLSADDKHVELLGYGVYVGDEVPPMPPPMAGFKTWEELDAFYEEHNAPMVQKLREEGQWPLRMENPKIELDSGEIVWGQECWWGSEDKLREYLEEAVQHGLEVVDVSIAEKRAELVEGDGTEGAQPEDARGEPAW